MKIKLPPLPPIDGALGYTRAQMIDYASKAVKLSCAAPAAEEAPLQEPDRTGMTYYKNDACKAKDANASDCICWTPKQQPATHWEPQLKRIHPLDIPLEVFLEDLPTRPRRIINSEMAYFTHSGDESIKPPFTVRHLMMFSRREIRKWPNMGKKSLNEIEEWLRNLGLQLWESHDERSLKLLRDHPMIYTSPQPTPELVQAARQALEALELIVQWDECDLAMTDTLIGKAKEATTTLQNALKGTT